MSTGAMLEIGSEVLDVKRVRCRYVKGGLRMVIVFCVGCELVSSCAACDNTASAETDAMVGTRVVSIHCCNLPYFKKSWICIGVRGGGSATCI